MTRIFLAPHPQLDRLAALFTAEMPESEILTTAPDPHGPDVPYIVVSRPPAGVIAAVPGLQVVLSLNAGVEHLLEAGEIPAHVGLARMVDDGLTFGMTEWVMAQVLAWHRNMFAYVEAQAAGIWQPLDEKLACERTVCILGAGALGRPVAESCRQFGFQTRVWSRGDATISGVDAFVGRSNLLAAVGGADILINLLPLTAETRNIVDARVFDAMAKGGLFVNGARGGHVVDDELLDALDSGQVGSAVLDVFRTEPLPSAHRFWTHPRLRLTPHVAALTHLPIAVKKIVANISRHRAGLPLTNAVDLQKGY